MPILRRLLFLFSLSACAYSQTTVTTILPADGATAVPLNAHVIVALSYSATYTLNPLKVTKGGVAVAGTVQNPSFASGGIAPPAGAFGWTTFVPSKPLDPNSTYKVEVDSPNGPPFFTSFTTGAASDLSPLQLVSTDPTPGLDGVNTQGIIKLRFNKPLDPFSFKQGLFDVNDITLGSLATGIYFAPQLLADGVTLAFNGNAGSAYTFPLGHAFQFEAPSTTFTDWLGNPFSGSIVIPFTTLRTDQKSRPVFTGSVPADGDANIPINSSIVLVFQRPLGKIAYDSNITLDAGGPVKFKLDNTIGSGNALVVQPSVLFPPNSVVTLRATGLVDASGAVLSSPITIVFHTGPAPSVQPLQVTKPATSFPQSATIQAIFNRPVDPLLLSLGGVSISGTGPYNGFLPVPYAVSADHRRVTLNPIGSLPAGSYSANISVPFDPLQGKLQAFPISFTVTGDVDTTPPQIISVNPPDGTTDAPISSVIQVAFSEPVTTADAATVPLQLIENGSPVAGSFTLNGTIAAFGPKSPLDPSAAYQIQVSGLSDLSGNALAPFSSSFTTAASSSASGTFQVISSSPAANATGVDPTAPITLTFNRAVDPVSLQQLNTNFLTGAKQYPCSIQVNGAVVTFTPLMPLPKGTFSVFLYTATDLAGSLMKSFSSRFDTADPATPDTSPITVVSVSPPDGGTVLPTNPYVVFTFSKPVDPSTVSPANFQAYSAKGNRPVTTTLLNGGTQVAIQFTADPGSLVTLYVNPEVRDLNGNAGLPFRTTVQTSTPPLPSSTFVIRVRPGYDFPVAVPPNTSIVLLFSAPVDPVSVEQALLVTVNGGLVSGKIEWTPDAMGMTFTPSVPFPYAAGVNIAILGTARDAAGNLFSSTAISNSLGITIASAPQPASASLALVGSNVSFLLPSPLDTVIELAFDRDLPRGILAQAVGKITSGFQNGNGVYSGPIIPCTVTLGGPRVLRFQPATLLAPDMSYVFQFDSGSGLKWDGGFGTGTAKAAPNPSLIAYGPTGHSVPLNAQISVAFSASISPLALPGALTLQYNGTTVPSVFKLGGITFSQTPSNRSLTLIPLGLLHANSDYTVVAAGFEDLAGHAVPPQTWTFHTSGTVDQQPPSVLRIDPVGDAVSPTTGITVNFSEPIATDWIDRFAVMDTGGGIPNYLPQSTSAAVSGTLRFSADQRNLYFTPDQPLPLGHAISVSVPVVSDFAGNQQVSSAPYNLSSSSFRVGLAAAGAPAVVGVTPDDESVGLPLNVKIQALFDQPVMASSLQGILLMAGGQPVTATVQLEADGHTVTVIPQTLLAAGSTYTLSVSGVTNTAGVAMSNPSQSSFTIGSEVDNIAPTYRSSPDNGQTEVPLNAVMRVRFSEQLNKLTVNTNTVSLTQQGFGSVGATVNLQDGGRTIVVTPVIPLVTNGSYVLTFNVADLAGNVINGNFGNSSPSVYFNTSSGLPQTQAVLLAVDPQDGSQNVPPSVKPQLLFNQPVDIPDGAVQVLLGGSPIPGTVSMANHIVTFTPAGSLRDGAYQLLASGLADVSGQTFDPIASTFIVSASGADPTLPKFVSSNPARGAVGISVSSPIVLTFSKPVAAVSVARLQVGFQNSTVPGAWSTQGAVATFTPADSMPGAMQISVFGSVLDLGGLNTTVSTQFTTGANPDTTPPTLTFSYPSEGMLIPAQNPQITLRFSKPVTPRPGTNPIQIFGPGANFNSQLSVGEDGRTFTGLVNLTADSDITISITSDLQDFAGNSIQPVAIHFRIAPYVVSQGPAVTSVSPADGAMNVPVNTPIELHFNQPMDASSMQGGLTVTNSGASIAGTITQDSMAQVFDFQPGAPYQTGSEVDVFPTAVFGVTGVRLAPFYSHFTTASAAPAATQAAAFSASSTAIDVRFCGLVPDTVEHAYLRLGQSLIPSRWVATGWDQIRIIPESRLQPGETYGLVLDTGHEIAIRVENPEPEPPVMLAAEKQGEAIHLRFDKPMNALSVRNGGIRLGAADGSTVEFTVLTSLDSKDMVLVPSRSGITVKLQLKTIESKAGVGAGERDILIRTK
jgi:hypothetical protein